MFAFDLATEEIQDAGKNKRAFFWRRVFNVFFEFGGRGELDKCFTCHGDSMSMLEGHS